MSTIQVILMSYTTFLRFAVRYINISVYVACDCQMTTFPSFDPIKISLNLLRQMWNLCMQDISVVPKPLETEGFAGPLCTQ